MFIRKKYHETLIRYQDTEFIKIITGVRRSGKSTVLKMYRDHLDASGAGKVIYLNFEHPDTFAIQTCDTLYEYIKRQVSPTQRVYFLFDEIQEVDEWQRLINGLRVAFNCDIIVTGSNAALLSGELATYLTGRYVEVKVYPFSFAEIVTYLDLESEKDIQVAFEKYLKFGGFASVVNVDDELLKVEVLQGIYNSVLLRDVTLRAGVEDIDMLMRISLYLMDNIGNTVSTNKVANYIKSQGYSTSFERVDRYLKLLEDAFIFYKVQRYDIRGKERLKTLGKYYVVDAGLRNAMLQRSTTNRGSQLENSVFLKLIDEGYRVFVGKYDNLEIDFVCFKNDVVKYVQVTHELPRDNQRETQNLLKIKENYDKLVVTMNYLDVGVVDGVAVKHVIDFLLEAF